jgi:hypothetical protein
MIDNPAYKGEWAPRQIPNPDYFEDLHPASSLNKIGGVGVELWTMTEDILFDNIYVGHSPEDARKLAEETFFVKKPLETAQKAIAEDEEDDEIPSFSENPTAFIRFKVISFIEQAKLDPVLAFKSHPETGAALLGVTLTFFGMLASLLGLIGGAQKPITKASISDISHVVRGC